MARSPTHKTANCLLDALPGPERAALLARAALVELAVQEAIYVPGAPLVHVYFPVDCVISMLQRMDNGSESELSSVGREGMAGIVCLLDADRTPLPAVCTQSGTAYRVPVGDFLRAAGPANQLRRRALQYVAILAFELGQHSVCNRFHQPTQRLARWLLLNYDRTERDSLEITHLFLTRLMGIQRPAVSLAANTLQKNGAISYQRGRIELKSRQRLEAAACECYGKIAAEFRRFQSGTPLAMARNRIK